MCDKYGVLLILDETSRGWGARGYLYACDEDGVAPDLLTIAKGFGAGYQPIGATLVSDRIYRTIVDGSGFQHGHTYLGHATVRGRALEVQRVIAERSCRQREGARRATARIVARALRRASAYRRPRCSVGVGFVRDRDSKATFDPALKLHAAVKREAMQRGLMGIRWAVRSTACTAITSGRAAVHLHRAADRYDRRAAVARSVRRSRRPAMAHLSNLVRTSPCTNRLPPFDPASATDEQKAVLADILSGPRGNLNGRFSAGSRFRAGAMRRRVLAAIARPAAAPVGTRDSRDGRALALAGRVAHPPSDRTRRGRAGRDGRRDPARVAPAFESDDDALIHAFASELYDTRRVSDATFARAQARFGHETVVNLVAFGYYALVAMTLNTFAHAQAQGQIELPFPE